jgi:hypothetical protein
LYRLTASEGKPVWLTARESWYTGRHAPPGGTPGGRSQQARVSVLVSWLLPYAIAATVLGHFWAGAAQAPADDSADYWQWRDAQITRAERAVAAWAATQPQRLPCALVDVSPSADAATLETLVAEALALHPPREILFAHGEYLLAVEQLRLAVEALGSDQPGGRRAAQAATLVCERLAALDAQRQSGAVAAAPAPAPGLPTVLVPGAPTAALASAASEGLELAVVDARRPFVPPEGAPADPALEYLLLRFRLANASGSSVPYFPLADFALGLPDGGTLQPVALGSAERYESGELLPGDALVANVMFLIPRGAAPLILHLTPARGPALDLTLP